MKVSRSFMRIIVTILISAAALCLPMWSNAGNARLKYAPINPEYIKYKNSKSNAVTTLQGINEHATGLIPTFRDTSYLKGKRMSVAGSRILGTFPSSYDLRDYNKITSIKDQGNCGSCWSFAAMACLESGLMPSVSWDFSENNLKNLSGFDWECCDGGNSDLAAAYLLRWDGPVSETDDPYKMSCSSVSKTKQKHVQEYIQIPPRASSLDNDGIKQALMTYGAVYVNFSIYSDYYNSTTHAYYMDEELGTNHAVCIVGWDDNYSKSNFLIEPPGDGAFIIKNSWGASWGDKGYFYISYYDANLAVWAAPCVFRAEPTNNYTSIYQYDTLGWVWDYSEDYEETSWFANVFTAANNYPITAVGWYTAEPDSPYEVYIYKEPTNGPISAGGFVEKKTGTITDPGYTTVKLDHLVSVTEGQTFSVVVKLTTPGYPWPVPIEMQLEDYSSLATANPGESYVSTNGVSWNDITQIGDYYGYDMTNTNVCLKAYSVDESRIPPELAVTSPTTESTYYTKQNSIDICGIASDNRSVSSVKWENTTIGSGEQSCENGGNWATWIARDIGLEPSVSNNVVFTAIDSDENETTTTLIVYNDTVSPSVTITSPTTEDYYPRISSIDISGTASDNFNVGSVTWSNSATGESGTCTCTGAGTANASWSASEITIADGDTTNVITVTAADSAGNTSIDTLTIVDDNVNPTIAITGPTSESTYYPETSAIDISGNASDNYYITSVTWYNTGTNNSGICASTSNGEGGVTWGASGLALADGKDANVIIVTAFDMAGNASNDTLIVTHYPAMKEIRIFPSKVGLVQGMSQEFKAVPIDINGNIRPFPGGTNTLSWSTTTGEIDSQTGEFRAGSNSSVVTVTSGSTTSQVDVEVFPETKAGGYVLERWWGGNVDKPIGVALGLDGSVYLADSLNDRIQKYGPAGTYDDSFAGIGTDSFDTPRGIAVDSSGNFYISDTRNNRIQKYNSDWEYITQWGSYGAGNGQFISPHGIAVGDGDDIYVADSGNNRIQKFDEDGNYLAQLSSSTTTGADFSWPRDVAVVDRDGVRYVYVIDMLKNRVVEFSEQTSSSLVATLSGSKLGVTNIGSTQGVTYCKVTSWGSGGTGNGEFMNPTGIEVGLTGDVFVSDYLNNRVQVFDSAGTFLGQWGEYGTSGGQFVQPVGIRQDADGNIYVVDMNNDRVQKYVPDEDTTVVITSPEDDFDGFWHSPSISITGITTGVVVGLTWSNSTTGNSGTCTGLRDWSAADVPLALGRNIIIITAQDSAGNEVQQILTVYYTADNHALIVSAPSLSTSTVESASATTVSSSVVDSQGHDVTYTWSDGGVGGSFADPHASSTIYTAPVNSSGSDVAVTITCQATCTVDSSVKGSASVGLIVTGGHAVTISAGPTLTPSTVDPEQSVTCSVTAVDSRGDGLKYRWSDSGAGGTFSPSASVQNPTYTAPANTTDSVKNISITCTATCTSVSTTMATGTAVLTVNNPKPTISITGPTSDDSTTRTGANINLSGTASSDTTTITWANAGTGESGSISGGSSWQIDGIEIVEGDANVITVTAHDAAGQSVVDSIQVTRESTPVADVWQGLAMVSLPIIPDDTDPKNVVSFYDVDWMTYRTKSGKYYGYGNDTNHYCWFDPTSATPGRGFWTRFYATPVEPCGEVPDQTASTTEKPNKVSIHLYKGWNLIGQPFMKTVTWDTAKITVQTVAGTSMTLKAAGAYVKNYAWGWQQNDGNPYTGAYYLVGDPDTISGATDEMAPWRAYWIKALQECYLVMPAP